MSSLLMQAAQSAAQADGLPAVMAPPKKKGPPLRRGKWTPEEEAYANRLIQEFKAGLLPLTDGTTLRTFLSKLLNCDPMRISKKFVGSNCIGKQVFRRRTADLNRLTPEQIQQSRAELSELERRFLERVAQTNRVKSSGVAAAAPPMPTIVNKPVVPVMEPPMPPWLQTPLGYQGNARAAAAGRALLNGNGKTPPNIFAAIQQQSNLLLNSNTGLEQLAASTSAARLSGLEGNLLRSGLSRDQLGQLAQNGLSSSSLSNMMQRQNSFDALMSLDFQSLQSIDNLANLIQTTSSNNVPETTSGMRNADFFGKNDSRLASAGRMESLLRTLSGNNCAAANAADTGTGSNANLSNLLQSVQQQNQSNNLLGNAGSAVSLANLLRQDSSTGLSTLRVKDGLNQRNSSVDDFLSLVATGDIPHQDASMLNVSLMQQQQQQQQPSSAHETAKLLAKQQLIQAASSGNLALVNAASRSLANLQQQEQGVKRKAEQSLSHGDTKR